MRINSTAIVNAVMAGFITIGIASLVGCADTEPPAYNPPVRVVHEPTQLYSVPGTEASTTTTTQYNNGTTQKQTTTDYNPPYTAAGPPYKTTVLPAAP